MADTPFVMSTTPPPPEPPTRRLDPAPPPVAYERVVEPGIAPADPNLMFVRLEDAISSLRTGLVFVGLLTVIAIGLAVYALTRDDNTSNGTRSDAASTERVVQLDDRVDRLSRQVQQARADARAARDVGTRVDTALRSQAGNGAASANTTQAITDFGKRVDDLDQRVQDLSAGQTTP